LRAKLGDVAAAFGKGIFAGVIGTAAMTISSTVEMKLRDRAASSALAQAAAKVLGGFSRPRGSWDLRLLRLTSGPSGEASR